MDGIYKFSIKSHNTAFPGYHFYFKTRILLCHFYYSFNILIAPWPTITKTIIPIIKSGYFEFVRKTSTPAKITPQFTITSFEVQIELARICASLFLLFCNKYRQIPFTINANAETKIIASRYFILLSCNSPSQLPQP